MRSDMSKLKIEAAEIAGEIEGIKNNIRQTIASFRMVFGFYKTIKEIQRILLSRI
jgi:hypothetical protein